MEEQRKVDDLEKKGHTSKAVENKVINSTPDDNICFVITGFGKFGNISDNPTTTLVHHIISSSGDDNKNARSQIGLCTVVKTAASDVKLQVDTLMNDIVNGELSQQQQNSKHVVLVHLGVDYKAATFKLETTAFNEASFRIPDEDGYQPKRKQINENSPLDERLCTTLNVKKICNDLQQRAFDVRISGDCGRFVCNYLYYSSLNEIKNMTQDVGLGSEEQSSIQAIFVHVPLFSVINEATQIEFITNLLDAISKDVKSPKKKKKKKKKSSS